MQELLGVLSNVSLNLPALHHGDSLNGIAIVLLRARRVLPQIPHFLMLETIRVFKSQVSDVQSD
jgi:hypothetical protein